MSKPDSMRGCAGYFCLGTHSKRHLLRHCSAVLAAKMSVDFHCKGTAVLMAKPARHRRNVNTRLDAPRSKQVAQVVMRKSGDTNELARPRQRLFTFTFS